MRLWSWKTNSNWLLLNMHKSLEFHLSNGNVLKTLEDIYRALYTMSNEEYHRHVTAAKNDFAVWIRDCLKDPELAEDMCHAQNTLDARTIIAARLRVIKAKHIKRKQDQFWKNLMADTTMGDPVKETLARIEYVKQLIRRDDFKTAHSVLNEVPKVYSQIAQEDKRRHELLYQIIKLKDYVEAFV